MNDVTKVVDPLTKTIIQLTFENIVDEASDILEKTCVSTIMAEIQDYAVALFDAKGRLLALPNRGLPLHVASCELKVKAVLDKWGDDFQPGDVIVENDPWVSYGNHLCDWTFVRPLFIDNELTFFVTATGHQMDTKGNVPGGYCPGAFDIQAEGLIIPPTKIFKGGERQEVYDFILHNVRWVEIVKMDNASLVGSLESVQLGVVALCKRYGKGTVLAAADILIEESEKAMRAEISQWPDGTYYGESVHDRDGSGAEDVKVRAEVTIKGDEFVADLSKSDKQVTFINSPIGCTTSMSLIGILPCFNPDIPNNHGKLKTIKITAEKGTCCNPEYPATVGSCAVYLGSTIVEALQMAMGKIVPDKVWGPSGAGMYPIFVGFDPRIGVPYWAMGDAGGGGGASNEADGPEATGVACSGGQMVAQPIEQLEIKYPFRMHHVRLVNDSPGPGKHRGGAGVDWLGQCYGIGTQVMTGACGGEKWPLFGIAGGKASGILNRIYTIKEGKETARQTVTLFLLETGESLGGISGGGGGWGNPFERPIEKVREDVRDEFVSVEKAREDYGVVINPKTFEVDLDATNKLRSSK